MAELWRQVPTSYADWRSQIPWTDAEISATLREAAGDEKSEYVKRKRLQTAEYFNRTGRLSKFILSLVLPRLVKHCEECGKTALYRVGVHGYCRAHSVSGQGDWRAQLKADREARYTELDQYYLERERQFKAIDKLKKTGPGRSTSRRRRDRG